MSMGDMPGANFALVTEWVTYSICPFWTGTQRYRYRNELGDRNHVILLSDLCCGEHHHHLSPGDLGASVAAAGTTVQHEMCLHQLGAHSGPWHSADGPLSCPLPVDLFLRSPISFCILLVSG